MVMQNRIKETKASGVFIFLCCSILFISSCNDAAKNTKEAINKTGEKVGKSATEFFEGVSEGIDQTLQCDISLSQDLKDKGLESGKFEITNDSQGGHHNVLTLYIIFNKNFKGRISAKVFDKNGTECGRTLIPVEGVEGNAGYFDFTFDKRTRIEARSRITLE
jgi:hypothetical protein